MCHYTWHHPPDGCSARLIISFNRCKPGGSWLLLYNGDMWQEEDVAAGGLSVAGVCSRAQLGLERHGHELGPPGSQLVHRHCPCGRLQPPAALLSPAGRGYASLCSAISVHRCWWLPAASAEAVRATGLSALPLRGSCRVAGCRGWHCSPLCQSWPSQGSWWVWAQCGGPAALTVPLPSMLPPPAPTVPSVDFPGLLFPASLVGYCGTWNCTSGRCGLSQSG